MAAADGVIDEEIGEGLGDAVTVTVTVTVAWGAGLVFAAPHAETASAVANAKPVTT